MNTEQDLINKLMISKKIMEKHNNMSRGSGPETQLTRNVQVEEFQPVSGNYNLPQDILMETQSTQSIKQPEVPTTDRILNSKLPDEIKRLMMEHPIEQPSMGSGTALSNDLVEKASRLMNVNAKGETINENTPRQRQQVSQQQPSSSFNPNELRDIVRETVEDVLKENGLLVESTTRADEVFKFRVGNHLFEGKVTKIKKMSK
jgi:hypothetical protein